MNQNDPHKGLKSEAGMGNAAYNIDQKDPSERLRSTLLLISAFIGVAILLFSLFCQKWLESVLERADGGYVQIAAAIVITLLALSIISGIFRSIFRAATFATGSQGQNKSPDPTVRIISGIIFLIVAFFLFNYVLSFLSQNQFFQQIETYLESGVQIETEEGDKTIKLENGKFTIEDSI